MNRTLRTYLTLFLASLLFGCTINYKTQPETTTPLQGPGLPAMIAPGINAPVELPKPITRVCLVSNLSPLSNVTEVRKEDYRESKDIVGYVQMLEAQQVLLLKAKEQYDRCKE